MKCRKCKTRWMSIVGMQFSNRSNQKIVTYKWLCSCGHKTTTTEER